MTFTFEPWMKITLIVIGVVLLIAMAVFLYLLIVGADESRSRRKNGRINSRWMKSGTG